MAKALFKTGDNGFLAGIFSFGMANGAPGTVTGMVHDGDTLNVSTANNFAVRFLGVDTPEISYHLPGVDNVFVSPADPRIASMLADPFGPAFPAINGLSAALRAALAARATPNAGANHFGLATEARDKLQALIRGDIAQFGLAEVTFKFFLAFAYEALDGYGRFLSYVHLDQPGVPAAQRKPSYNEQMLATGYSAPYFIFPNVDPFRSQGSPLTAVLNAHSPQNILAQAPRLVAARTAAKAVRAAHLGIHQIGNELVFDAFELRFLCDRRPPHRWVIDLSGDDRVLRHPQTYLQVPLAEDRLFVPPEFVPLFEAAGWTRDPSPTDLGL